MWVGGIDGKFIKEEKLSKYPHIYKLAKQFSDFQNGQWRGEYNQRTSLNFGDVRAILIEVARLLKDNSELVSEFNRIIEEAPVDFLGTGTSRKYAEEVEKEWLSMVNHFRSQLEGIKDAPEDN